MLCYSVSLRRRSPAHCPFLQETVTHTQAFYKSRSLCASTGGDIKRLRQSVLETPYRGAPPVGHEVRSIFEAEYRLVCQVAQYPKPIVSLVRSARHFSCALYLRSSCTLLSSLGSLVNQAAV